VPRGLKRYQHAGDLHFITFSCYRRQPLLGAPQARRVFEQTLERVRRWYGFYVTGYVVMPEHVHLLVSAPERSSLAVAMQMLKQVVAQKLRFPRRGISLFGKPGITISMFGRPRSALRSYGTCIAIRGPRPAPVLRWAGWKPVKRGLVEKPEDWAWSSFVHYVSGVEGTVEIESEWTGRRREQMGTPLRVKIRQDVPTLSPKAGEKDGAPST
jgi:putative transposase